MVRAHWSECVRSAARVLCVQHTPACTAPAATAKKGPAPIALVRRVPQQTAPKCAAAAARMQVRASVCVEHVCKMSLMSSRCE